MTTTNNINKKQSATDMTNAVIDDIPMDVRIFCKDVSDLPKDPMSGTTAIVPAEEYGYEIYLCVDDQWLNLGPASEEKEDEFTVVGTNCPNCGAVVNKHTEECEYCGTPYAKMRVK